MPCLEVHLLVNLADLSDVLLPIHFDLLDQALHPVFQFLFHLGNLAVLRHVFVEVFFNFLLFRDMLVKNRLLKVLSLQHDINVGVEKLNFLKGCFTVPGSVLWVEMLHL